MFNFIKNALKKVYSSVSNRLTALFGNAVVDDATIQSLHTILLEADTGVATTNHLIDHVKKEMQSGRLATGEDLKNALEEQLLQKLDATAYCKSNAPIILLVGINGSGKTSTAGKLAHMLTKQGERPILVAADTFRAAAVEQLSIWAERTNSLFIKGADGQDPASVVYAGLEAFARGQGSRLIIDTAGRLQTKTYLMQELEKIRRIIAKKCPETQVSTLLTIDAMLGQNSFDQAKLFHESTQLDGIVLTKMDGTGKGGIVFSITQAFQVPVAYITYGEELSTIKPFDSHAFVSDLLGN